MKKIKFGLSVREIRKAQDEIRKYQEEIKDKCEELAFKLAQRGVEIAKMNISMEGAVYTGELLDSIDMEQGDVLTNGSSYVVYTDCEWAPYVEFGTGIVGSENPHPDTSIAGWKYDVNEHGDKGWVYYKDGEFYWTKGMPSRPFMYNSGYELSLEVSKIAKEVFGK